MQGSRFSDGVPGLTSEEWERFCNSSREALWAIYRPMDLQEGAKYVQNARTLLDIGNSGDIVVRRVLLSFKKFPEFKAISIDGQILVLKVSRNSRYNFLLFLLI